MCVVIFYVLKPRIRGFVLSKLCMTLIFFLYIKCCVDFTTDVYIPLVAGKLRFTVPSIYRVMARLVSDKMFAQVVIPV